MRLLCIVGLLGLNVIAASEKIVEERETETPALGEKTEHMFARNRWK